VIDDKIPKLKSILAACRTAFIYVGIFSFFVNLLMLTVPLYMLQIFDRVLASQSIETLGYLTLIAIGALLVLGLLDVVRSRILVRVSHWLDGQLSPLAMMRSADEQLRGGQYSTRSIGDIVNIRQFLASPAIFFLFDAPWIPVFIFVVYLLHPVLGILLTIGAILLFLLALLNEIATRDTLAEANIQNTKNSLYLNKAMNNAEAIQAMGMLRSISNRWFEGNSIVLYLQKKASDRSATILSFSKFLRMALQLSILGLGAYFVIQNQLTPGGMIAASIIAARALAPIEQAIGSWKQWVSTRYAYQRLKEYLEKTQPRVVSIQLPEPSGHLQVQNLTYFPMGSRKPILQGVNITLPPGEVLALIGPSGSGKSTLARLMLGVLPPSHGAVRLDGASVYEWEREDFGRFVGYLPQDVELFSGTVRDNIARMSEGSDEAVVEAAKLVGAHEMILHLDNGYNFDSSGFNLSGGQRQRVALARAFYGDPRLIILDEPNSSLDSVGDAALSAAVEKARERNITIVLISHRPNLVQHADQVVILNEGRVQLQGPRDEVLQQVQTK